MKEHQDGGPYGIAARAAEAVVSASKHTPIPWAYHPRLSASENHRGFYITGLPSPWAHTAILVQPGDEDGVLGLANAEFIVRAVNSHGALVEALGKIAKKEGPFSRDPQTHAQNCVEAMAEIAVAALASARGEEVPRG